MTEKNATLNYPQKWESAIRGFVENTVKCMKQYYKGDNSKSGFAADWEIP